MYQNFQQNTYVDSTTFCIHTYTSTLFLLTHNIHGLPLISLRTSRFFPENDDSNAQMSPANLKANEYLYPFFILLLLTWFYFMFVRNRRVHLDDVVDCHFYALCKAPEIGYDLFIISAVPPPFTDEDLKQLGINATPVIEKYFPEYLFFSMFICLLCLCLLTKDINKFMQN